MTFGKFLPIALMTGALAFTIQILDQVLSGSMPIENNLGFGWIAFIAWPSYFLAGGTIDGGLKVFFGFLIGIAASIAIMEMAALTGDALGFFAVPAAIFVLVTICICLERFPPFDLVPAMFIGAGIFFGAMTYVPGASYLSVTLTEMTYCVIGLFYGWMTVFLRTKYEKFIN